MISHFTDTEGRWNAHVPAGEWIVTIDAFETSLGLEEILRELISVSAETASEDRFFSTGETANVVFAITDAFDGNQLSYARLRLTSGDGLGTILFDDTIGGGIVETRLPAGNWTVELNITKDSHYGYEGGTRWILDSMEIGEGGLNAGESLEVEIAIPRLIEMSGSVFWDYNDDNQSNVGEGIENTSITITALGENESVSHTGYSNLEGDWSIFVEAGKEWLVVTHRLGFFDNNNTTAILEYPTSIDIELEAGAVLIQGNVSYINAEELSQISEDVQLVLIPVEGYLREWVTPAKTYENGSWNGNWSASVDPGKWIIRATVDDMDLVAMALLEADVIEGGSVDIELTIGGRLRLVTEWLDYDGVSHSLAEADIEEADIQGDPSVVINIGAGISWIADFDENGVIEILLLSGMVDASSEFEVLQRNKTMGYYGEQGVTIRLSQETPLTTLFHTRIVDHEIRLTTLNSTAGENLNDGDAGFDVITTANEEEGFDSVDFIIAVDYLGDEPFDSFTVGATVPGTDGVDWLVEFHNGSGVWNTSTSFDLGLENSLNLSGLNIRVTPPNQTVAHSFDQGHFVNLLVSTSDGYLKEHTVIVRIPRIYGFELTEPMDEVIGMAAGETTGLKFDFKNTGNADEKFRFEFDDSSLPENWSAPSNTTHTLAAFVDTTHTLSFTVPEGASDESFTIYINVSSDYGGQVYPAIAVNIQISQPALRIDSHNLYSGGVDAVSGQIVHYTVVVKNDGLIDAQMVQLNGTLCDNLACTILSGVDGTDIRDVPANSEAVFEIELDLSNISTGTYYIQFELNSSGFDSVEEYDSAQVKVRSPPIEETTDWIGWLLGALLVIALLLLSRGGGGRRRSSAPF